MTFKTHVLPGVRAFTSSMRVKLPRGPTYARPAKFPLCAPTPGVKPAHRQVHWRVSPATGQLEHGADYQLTENNFNSLELPMEEASSYPPSAY